jgi:catechol 2,3-dioxygenase-like lactoylglutathione lyase family enzyme
MTNSKQDVPAPSSLNKLSSINDLLLTLSGISPSNTQVSIEGKSVMKVLSPTSLAHVVFRTADINRMTDFWTLFLGATVTYKNDTLVFLRYDDEHHRIAIIAAPETLPRARATAGLHHIAFGFDSLADLIKAYNQRKAHGILPTWTVNHGPTTSIYYQDPDGNLIETQVDNFDTSEEANAFMMSELFAENPIGTDFDPEEWERSMQNGEDEKKLKKRVEIGARGLPEGL